MSLTMHSLNYACLHSRIDYVYYRQIFYEKGPPRDSERRLPYHLKFNGTYSCSLRFKQKKIVLLAENLDALKYP